MVWIDWVESESMANGTRKPMRQGQQNRRGRGRGRKVQNSLSRNLESNGPDVKIRGTAAHIAEKYAALARDAQSSGDTVAAENYLQHAEHYNRIIMANQQAQAENANANANAGANANGSGRGRANGSGDGEQAEAPRESSGDARDNDARDNQVSDDDGVARTIARTVKRSSNGSASEDEDSSNKKDSEEPTDEAVT